MWIGLAAASADLFLVLSTAGGNAGDLCCEWISWFTMSVQFRVSYCRASVFFPKQ